VAGAWRSRTYPLTEALHERGGVRLPARSRR